MISGDGMCRIHVWFEDQAFVSSVSAPDGVLDLALTYSQQPAVKRLIVYPPWMALASHVLLAWEWRP